jgi:hypothetical protein
MQASAGQSIDDGGPLLTFSFGASFRCPFGLLWMSCCSPRACWLSGCRDIACPWTDQWGPWASWASRRSRDPLHPESWFRTDDPAVRALARADVAQVGGSGQSADARFPETAGVPADDSGCPPPVESGAAADFGCSSDRPHSHHCGDPDHGRDQEPHSIDDPASLGTQEVFVPRTNADESRH